MAAELFWSAPLRRALGAYAAAVGVFLVTIIVLRRSLPARVATHFDGAGRPGNWSSPGSLEISLGLTGLLVPAFVVAIAFVTRYAPANRLNVPHPEYWRDPINRPRATEYLLRSGVWMGAALTLWWAAFYCSVVQANTSTPIRLSTAGWLVPTVLLLGFVVAWITALWRHFSRISVARQGGRNDEQERDLHHN